MSVGLENKRIAFIISSLNYGGAQRAVANLSLAIPDDWEIDIILNDDKSIVYPYRGNIISLGIALPENRDAIIYQLRALIKRITALKRLKKQKRYVAVISYLHSSNVANVLSGKHHCRIILSVRNNLSTIEKKWKRCLISKTVKLLYNRADKVITLSKGVEKDMVSNHGVRGDKANTIYNCYNIDEIIKLSDSESAVKTDSNKVNFATMGRLTTPKGHWHLIRAFSKVASRNKDAMLYILGEGELRPYFRELIGEYELESRVIMCGFVENPYAALAGMDVFVFPSLWEGFGNALLEAMACGLPCIATDYESGAREIMQDIPGDEDTCKDIEYTDYGILVPLFDGKKYHKEELTKEEDCLAEAMIEMSLRDDLRSKYSELAQKRAGMFSGEAIWQEWEKEILQ